MAAGERLVEQHQVGLDTPVLAGEKFPGASQARLDFVRDEQRAVAAAEMLGALEVSLAGQDDTLALNRLDHEGRYAARGQRLLQRDEVVERNARTIRQQRLEALAEDLIAIEGERAAGQAVKCVAAIDDPGPAGRRARELDRSLDRFRAGVREEYFFKMRHEREQPLGEQARKRRDIHLNQIGQIGVEHALERSAYCRMIAPDREHAIAAQQINIPLTLAIVEVLSLSLAKADVIPDGPEHPHHLLVEPTGVEIEALGFVGGEQGRDIECGT